MISLFHLNRLEDESQVSGTGIVADGVIWPDGSASLKWRGPVSSWVNYRDFNLVEAIHGHAGKTQVLRHPASDGDRCIDCRFTEDKDES